MLERRFTLTQEHVALLRRAYVRWEDCETGAPAIDCKRPYGNSSVALDVAEILGVPIPDDGLDDETRGRMLALHYQTLDALQIILATGSFELGEYVQESYRAWLPATAPSGRTD